MERGGRPERNRLTLPINNKVAAQWHYTGMEASQKNEPEACCDGQCSDKNYNICRPVR
jgi:hypothetical protein